MSESDAEYYIVGSLGFSKKATAEIISSGDTHYCQKSANYPMAAMEGAGMSSFGETALGGVTGPTYDIYSGDRRQKSTGELYASSDRLKPNNIADEISKAVNLSEMGMRDVFDKSMVGSLTKLTDVNTEVRSYIPDIMSGLDKVARMLFVFWYKGDLIKDRFSINEFSGTEDLLKDTFKNLGEIILDLKKKYGHVEG
jgi:hypothetical protein